MLLLFIPSMCTSLISYFAPKNTYPLVAQNRTYQFGASGSCALYSSPSWGENRMSRELGICLHVTLINHRSRNCILGNILKCKWQCHYNELLFWFFGVTGNLSIKINRRSPLCQLLVLESPVMITRAKARVDCILINKWLTKIDGLQWSRL